jgi:hypothetical protein
MASTTQLPRIRPMLDRRSAVGVAEHAALLPPPAGPATNEPLNFGMNIPQADAALADLYRFVMLEVTEDKAESHQAWRDRRRPRFTGR